MPRNAIFAIVLAAGASTRFGRTKQLESFDGLPLVTGAIRKAEAVCGDRTVLVVGKDWQQVAAACEPLRGFFVINDDYAQGIAGSIACGVRTVAECADAVILTMADLPLIGAVHFENLARTWTESPHSIVASAFEDTLGPPAVFPKADFDALLALQGDRGARPVIDANPDRVLAVSCEEAAFDIDRPEDLAGIY